MIKINQNDFIEYLKKYKIKVTSQRLQIFEIIKILKNHPTAEIIFQKVSKNNPTITFDTVYRTLQLFSEIGLLGMVCGNSGARKYDTVLEQHHHFICVSCGEITDFYNSVYDELNVPDDIVNKGSFIRKKVVIEGICNNCQKNK